MTFTGDFGRFRFWTFTLFFEELEYYFYLKVPRLNTQHFHTKLPRQKSKTNKMWSINWICHNESFIESWFNLPTTEMSISILFVSAWVLFEGAFSVWVALILVNGLKENSTRTRSTLNMWFIISAGLVNETFLTYFRLILSFSTPWNCQIHGL